MTTDQAQTTRPFALDRAGALDVIAEVWGLVIAEPSEWRLDRFGSDFASSIENLTTVAFSRHRGLVHGPAGEIRVYPIAEPDPHLVPALVCLDLGGGPMLSVGIESLPDALPDPWGASPQTVLDALEHLLGIAGDIYAGSAQPYGVPRFAPDAAHPDAPAPGPYRPAGVSHPIG